MAHGYSRDVYGKFGDLRNASLMNRHRHERQGHHPELEDRHEMQYGVYDCDPAFDPYATSSPLDNHYEMYNRPCDLNSNFSRRQFRPGPTDLRERYYEMKGHHSERFEMQGYSNNLNSKFSPHIRPLLTDWGDRCYKMRHCPSEVRDEHFYELRSQSCVNSNLAFRSSAGSADYSDRKSSTSIAVSPRPLSGRKASESSQGFGAKQKKPLLENPDLCFNSTGDQTQSNNKHRGDPMNHVRPLSGRKASESSQGFGAKQKKPLLENPDLCFNSTGDQTQSSNKHRGDPMNHVKSTKGDNDHRMHNKRGRANSWRDERKEVIGTHIGKASPQKTDKGRARDVQKDKKGKVSIDKARDSKLDDKLQKEVADTSGAHCISNVSDDEGMEADDLDIKEGHGTKKSVAQSLVFRAQMGGRGKLCNTVSEAMEVGHGKEHRDERTKTTSETVYDVTKCAEGALVKSIKQKPARNGKREAVKTKEHFNFRKQHNKAIPDPKNIPSNKSRTAFSASNVREKPDRKKERTPCPSVYQKVTKSEEKEGRVSAEDKKTVSDDSNQNKERAGMASEKAAVHFEINKKNLQPSSDGVETSKSRHQNRNRDRSMKKSVVKADAPNAEGKNTDDVTASILTQRKGSKPAHVESKKEVVKRAVCGEGESESVPPNSDDVGTSKCGQRYEDRGGKKVTKDKVGLTTNCKKESNGGGGTKTINEKIRKTDAANRKYIVAEDVEKALKELDKSSEKCLSGHESKICQANINLKTLSATSVNTEKDALMDRLTELINQEEEFKTRIQELKSFINKLHLQSSTKEELSAILLSAGIECRRLSARLPMYARRKDIVKHVASAQVSIVIGETGSGKSTQMVQYMLEAGFAPAGKQIVCTQPRKVAAMSLTERVSSELLKPVGKLVGYRLGARQKTSPDTKIVFTTDHSLLNECLKDPILSKYSCIVIDEAHERSIYTDLLLGMIKSFLPQRPDLKVIITSATISPELFIRYFKTSEELRVSGRTFPVDVKYEETENTTILEKYEQKALNMVSKIHKQEGEGDILVFMPTSAEIMRCCDELPNRLRGSDDYVCLPLHGQLLPGDQKKVFQPVDQGKRKIVFATNCAESSLTIDGIKYVVDTGVVNEMRYDPHKKISSLGIQIISKSSADQRKGRAGRTSSGTCIRLYSKEDYEAMRPTMQPEILRINLGQAILKLAELKVDIRKYDFVESPEQVAIDSDMSILQGLGALTQDTQITDLGKWLAKLPFDPRQGYLIYYGRSANLLYDSVVVASLISNGSNLIFRGLNESEEQIAARTRNKFGSMYGDIFTWLEIYKCWKALPKNKRPKWCREHCVNNKALNFAEQTVNDVNEIFKREFDIKLDFKFTEDGEHSISILRHLIFEAYLPSLSLYLGHHRAGYFAPSCQQQVHVHPSSNLCGQSGLPQWVVYLHSYSTSKNFIRGITVVDQPWIEDAIEQGKLPADFMKVTDQKINVVFEAELGRTAFSQMVGPRFSELKITEDSLVRSGLTCVVVEAERDLGTYEIYAASPMPDSARSFYEANIKYVTDNLRRDNVEFVVGKKEYGFRAQIGAGAEVVTLLMPDQSLKVRVSQALRTADENDVKAKFSQFGEITDCIKFKPKYLPSHKRPDSWGFVKFRTLSAAKKAVETTSKDEYLRGSFMIESKRNNKWSSFQAKLSWCRRPEKLFRGKGTKRMVIIKCSPFHRAALNEEVIWIHGSMCKIMTSRKNEDELVMFTGILENEEEIEAALIQKLELSEQMNTELRVNIVREQVKVEDEDLKMIKQVLLASFKRELPEGAKLSINLKQPKDFFTQHVAFISFDNAVAGFRACRILEHEGLYVKGNRVKIEPDLRTSFITPKAVFEVCEIKFNKIKEMIKEDYTNVTIGTRTLDGGDLAVDIQATDDTVLVRIRDALQKELVDGDIIDCSPNDLLKRLLSKQGREFLCKVEKEIGDVVLRPNSKTEKVHLFGTDRATTAAKSKINDFLDKCSQGVQEDIALNGQDKPLGLMKKVLHQFPNLPEDFISQFGVTDVTLDYKRHKLTLFGTKEAVAVAKTGIEEIQETFGGQDLYNRSNCSKGELPDCEVCMCPVESSTDLYRLEGCGHAYCLTCLKQQSTVEIESKQIPLLCTKDTCRLPWVWRDIQFCLRKNWVSETRLVEQAMSTFVSAYHDKYKFCSSPDCQIAYEVTSCEEGFEFLCPGCKASICTTCHKAFHAGITCSQAVTVAAADKGLEEMLKKDPKKFKSCPGCSTPIEKIEGCNKMHCMACKVYFCWICREKFGNATACYDHLSKLHGGFFQGE